MEVMLLNNRLAHFPNECPPTILSRKEEVYPTGSHSAMTHL